MGVLDDAIREHLELKRRHGADASEVARQEQEALGPARRGPEPLEVSGSPSAAPPTPLEPVDEPVLEEHAPEIDPEPAWEPEPYDEPEPDPELYREPAAAPPAPEPEPELFREPSAEPPAPVDQPTIAFDAAELREAQRRHDEPEPAASPAADGDEEEEEEDVLEETPDFLQETPEHDRLWFEQRPPRDFDFDG